MLDTQEACDTTNNLFDQQTQYADASMLSPMKDSPKKLSADASPMRDETSLQQTADEISPHDDDTASTESSDADEGEQVEEKPSISVIDKSKKKRGKVTSTPHEKEEYDQTSSTSDSEPSVSHRTYGKRQKSRSQKRKRRSNGHTSNPKDHKKNPGLSSAAKKRRMKLSTKSAPVKTESPKYKKPRSEPSISKDFRKIIADAKRNAVESVDSDEGYNLRTRRRSKPEAVCEAPSSPDEVDEAYNTDDTTVSNTTEEKAAESDASSHYGCSQDLDKRSASFMSEQEESNAGRFATRSTTNKPQFFKGYTFAISGCTAREEIKRQIEDHGGQLWEFEDFIQNAFGAHMKIIFVLDELSTTLKSMLGQSMGCAMVQSRFIRRCVERGRFTLPIPKDYLLNYWHFPEAGASELIPDWHKYRVLSNTKTMMATRDQTGSHEQKVKHLLVAMGSEVEFIPPMSHSPDSVWVKRLAGRCDHVLVVGEAPPNLKFIQQQCKKFSVPMLQMSFLSKTIGAGKPVINEETLYTLACKKGTRTTTTRRLSRKKKKELPKAPSQASSSDEEYQGIQTGQEEYEDNQDVKNPSSLSTSRQSSSKQENDEAPSDLDDKYYSKSDSEDDSTDTEVDPEPVQKVQKKSTTSTKSTPDTEKFHEAVMQRLGSSWMASTIKKWKSEFKLGKSLHTPVPSQQSASTFHQALIKFLQENVDDLYENWEKEFNIKGEISTLPEDVVDSGPRPVPISSTVPGSPSPSHDSSQESFPHALVSFLERDCSHLYKTWKSEFDTGKSFTRLQTPVASQRRTSTGSFSSALSQDKHIVYPSKPIRSDDLYQYYDSVKINNITYRLNDTVFVNLGKKVDVGLLTAIKGSPLGDELAMCEYRRFLSYSELMDAGLLHSSPTQQSYHENELFLTQQRVPIKLNNIAFKARILCPRLEPGQKADFHFCRRKIENNSLHRLGEDELWNGYLHNTVLLDPEPEVVEGREHYTNIALNGVQMQYHTWLYIRAVNPIQKRIVSHTVLVDDMWRSHGFFYLQLRKAKRVEPGLLKANPGDDALFILPAHQIVEVYPLSIVPQNDSPDYVPLLTKDEVLNGSAGTIYSKTVDRDIREAGLNVLCRRVKVLPFRP